MPVLSLIAGGKINNKYFFALIFVFLGFFAGLRGEGVDPRDYSYYQEVYESIKNIGVHEIYKTDTDFIYWFMSRLTQAINENIGFYLLVFIFALAGIILKYKSIQLINYDYGLFVIFLLSSYLYLHGFIQIRGGLAISFLWLSASNLALQKTKHAFLLYLLAVLSHASAIFGVLIFLVRPNFRYANLVFNIGLVAIYYIVSQYYSAIVDNILIVSLALSAFDLNKASYLRADQSLDLLAPMLIFQLMSYTVICFYQTSRKDEIQSFYLRVYGLAIMLYWLGSFSSVFSYRMLEMFSTFFVFSIASLAVSRIHKYFLIIIHSIVLYYLYMIRDPIVESYSVIWF
jgi:hypothetical protein